MKCLIITNKFMFHLSFTADFLDFLSFNICLLPFSTPLYLFIYSVTSVVSNSLWPYGLWPTRLLCLWDFPGKSTGVDCHFLFQGIFPTQGSNPGLPHCRQTLNRLSHQESPTIGEGGGNSLQYSCLENFMDRGAWWVQPMGSQRVRHDWATEHLTIIL